jgi:hypothetical protein
VIIPFAVMVWQGWTHRRNAAWHKRSMMYAAILVVMGPTIGRLPLAPPTTLGFSILHLLGFAVFIPLIVRDRRTEGQIHPATKLGLAMAAVAIFTPLAVFWFKLPWAKVAAQLPGVAA